ncbi:hypothetical protein K438DRAFT_1927309 [Mycena galopus ATCC 62051]|nr:hypothetical protein K438DRAFT_1927309 [Mycena galopus ATCC 62051]
MDGEDTVMNAPQNSAPPVQPPQGALVVPPQPPQQPPPPLPPVQPAPAPTPAPAPGQPQGMQFHFHHQLPVVIPSIQQLMARAIIPARAANTQLGFQPTQPPPPICPTAGHALIQHNNGQFAKHSVTNEVLLRNVAPTQLEAFNASPHHKVVLLMANGGNALFRANLDTPLKDQVTAALRTLVPTGHLAVHLPIAAGDAQNPVGGTAKYGGSHVVLVEIEDGPGAARVLAQDTAPVNGTVTWWAKDIAVNAATLPTAIGFLNAIVADGDPALLQSAAEAGMVHAALQDVMAVQLIDQGTQHLPGTPEQRVLDVLLTIHAVWHPHPTSPTMVMHMTPTTNATLLEAIYARLRTLECYAGFYGFKPRSSYGGAPECVVCKSAAHPSYQCPYTHMNPLWWGPPGQLSELPETHPLYHSGGGGGGNSGGGGGSGHNPGGGGNGRGGRGFPRGGGRGGGNGRGGGRGFPRGGGGRGFPRGGGGGSWRGGGGGRGY